MTLYSRFKINKAIQAASLFFASLLFVFLVFPVQQAMAGVVFTSQPSTSFPAPTLGNRSVMADFDGDGDADILYQTAGAGSAFQYARSNGDGTYTILSQAASPFAGLTLPDNTGGTYYAADMNGDGDIDLVVGVSGATGSYFRNDGSSFSSQSTTTFPAPGIASRLLIADFDGDGAADILYQTGGNGTAFQYAHNNGNGTFTLLSQAASPFAGLTMPDFSINSYKAADFDGDGDIDVWAPVANATGSYFRNDGSSFTSQSSATFPAPANIARVVVGDFDSDGDADMLYQTGGNGTAFQYARSNGDGTFTLLSLAASPFAGLTLPDNTSNTYYAGDIDGDGDIDIWAVVASTTGTYLREEGRPPFVASFSPANSATNVPVGANIVFTFSESVSKGTAGNVYVVRTSDNTVIQTVPVTGALVTGSGTGWTVNPASDLAASTTYAIRVDSKSFVDANGEIYKGIKTNALYVFTTAAALPVTLINFICYPSGSAVVVQWQTASEQNSGHFTVERSTDGITWLPIATLPAAGSSNTLRSYRYNDTSPPKGAAYYRIAETDIDGALTYSAVAEVTLLANASLLQVRQSGTATRLNIVIQSNTGDQYMLFVYAANGKLVYSSLVSAGTHALATQSWSKGIYLVALLKGSTVVAADKIMNR